MGLCNRGFKHMFVSAPTRKIISFEIVLIEPGIGGTKRHIVRMDLEEKNQWRYSFVLNGSRYSSGEFKSQTAALEAVVDLICDIRGDKLVTLR